MLINERKFDISAELYAYITRGHSLTLSGLMFAGGFWSADWLMPAGGFNRWVFVGLLLNASRWVYANSWHEGSFSVAPLSMEMVTGNTNREQHSILRKISIHII